MRLSSVSLIKSLNLTRSFGDTAGSVITSLLRISSVSLPKSLNLIKRFGDTAGKRITFLLFLVSILLTHSLHSQDSIRNKPIFTSKEITRVALGENYRYTVNAMDSVGIPISYSVKQLPAWLHYNEVDHTVSGTALKAGQYAIQLIASTQFAKASARMTQSDGEQHFMLTVYDKHTTNILCLGNSLTNGTNKYNSYRRDLWKMLHAAHYNFDLIGSWNKHHMGNAVPDDDFDTDHDGHSGWTIDNMFTPPGWDSIRGNINQWLTEYKPDIVLIELGTNDVFQCVKVADMMSKLDLLVETLRKKNKAVAVFIAQIPPLGQQWAPKKLCGDSVKYETVLNDLNKRIGLYSLKKNTKQSHVQAVDQFTGVNPATDMYDDIHPNDKGEKEMAKRWFNAIKIYLNKLSG